MTDSVAVFSPADRITANNISVPGAKVKFYLAGTSTPKVVYSDAALTVSLGTVVYSDTDGYPVTASGGTSKTQVYIDTTSFKLVVTDASDVVLWTLDNVKGAFNSGSIDVLKNLQGSIISLINDRLREGLQINGGFTVCQDTTSFVAGSVFATNPIGAAAGEQGYVYDQWKLSVKGSTSSPDGMAAIVLDQGITAAVIFPASSLVAVSSVQGAGATTTTLLLTATIQLGYFYLSLLPTGSLVGYTITMKSGALTGQSSVITAHTQGASPALTFAPAFTAAPASLDLLAITSTNVPTGIPTYGRFAMINNGFVLGTGGYVTLEQPIEGLRTKVLGFGTTAAIGCTVGFWVRSVSGKNFAFSVQNSARDRVYMQTFSVTQDMKWEFKTLYIPPCTDGTWVNDTGVGLRAVFTLSAESSVLGASATWVSSTLYGPVGTTNWTGVVMDLAGFFIVPGLRIFTASDAMQFQRNQKEELELCYRHYESVEGVTANAVTAVLPTHQFNTAKGTVPTIGTPVFSSGTGATFAIAPAVSSGLQTNKQSIYQNVAHTVAGAGFVVAANSRLT